MMIQVLKIWCKSLERKIRKRKSEKREEDRLRIPLPEEMRKLDSSQATQQAASILNEYVTTEKKIPKLKYAFVRDYLITKIITDNFQRSGVIGNMKLKEFERASPENDGSFIVSVLEHKTEIDGPADIVMEPKLFQMVERFIKFLRCQVIANSENEFVFITFSGMKLSSSMVTNSLNACWKRSLGDDYRSNVTCSLFRKLGTTTVHQHLPELKQNCAHLMTHSVRVAENEYNIHNKKATAVATSQKMKEAVRVDFSIDKDRDYTNLFNKNDKIDMETINQKLETSRVDITQQEKKKIYDRLRYKKRKGEDDEPCSSKHEESNKEQESETDSEMEDETKSKKRETRQLFTEHENSVYRKELKEWITSKRTIKSTEFYEMLKSNPRLNKLVKKFGVEKLRTKVFTERKRHVDL